LRRRAEREMVGKFPQEVEVHYNLLVQGSSMVAALNHPFNANVAKVFQSFSSLLAAPHFLPKNHTAHIVSDLTMTFGWVSFGARVIILANLVPFLSLADPSINSASTGFLRKKSLG